MDEWGLKIKLAAALFIVLMAGFASAQNASVIEIKVIDGMLTAETVYDDDDTIEFVDLYIGKTTVNHYRYSRVAQGTVFNAAFNSDDTIYYNFMDSDGIATNVGYFIYVQNATPPSDTNSTEEVPQYILGYEINVKRAEDNRNYYVEFVVDINSEISVSTAELNWGLGDAAGRSKRSSFTKDVSDGLWKTTIGPFTDRIIVNVSISVTDTSGKSDSLALGNRGFYLIVSSEAACEMNDSSVVINTAAGEIGKAEIYSEGISQVSSLMPTQEKHAGATGFADGKTAYFQDRDPSSFSYLKVAFVNDVLTATEVQDDDSKIQRTDLFVVQGTDISQYTYSNVAQGDTFPVDVPEGAIAYYNYMDTDGTVVNVSFNNVVGIETPPPTPAEKKADMLEKWYIDAAPDEDYTDYTVTLEAQTNDISYSIQSVRVYYSETSLGTTNIFLSREGDKWVGSIGPFTNEKLLKFRAVITDDTGYSQTKWLYPFWFDIVPPSQVRCIEICGNKVDDDKDGVIDEECVMLPDLMFTGTEDIPHFVVIGNPIEIPFTIKNAGIADTEEFDVALVVNNEVIDTLHAEAMHVDEYRELEFTVDDSNKFAGTNKVKLVLDYANAIPELNELNNEFAKDISVGYNGLIVILNNNKTNTLADEREMKVIDRFGDVIGGVKVTITYPSGEEIERTSVSDGIVGLQLTESGNYLVSAEKAGYTSFSGAFNIRAIKVSGIGDVLNVGETIEFTVETEDKRPVPDAKIEVEYPTGEKSEITLNELGLGQIRPTIAGGHKIIVTRNGIKVFESGFIATGLVESLFIGTGSVGELLFGSIIRNTLLFMLLLIICLIAAAFAYNRSKLLFVQKAKSTREKQMEIAARIGIAVLFFILPFQINKFFGLQASIASVIIEIVSVLIADYYAKQARRKKAIRVK